MRVLLALCTTLIIGWCGFFATISIFDRIFFQEPGQVNGLIHLLGILALSPVIFIVLFVTFYLKWNDWNIKALLFVTIGVIWFSNLIDLLIDGALNKHEIQILLIIAGCILLKFTPAPPYKNGAVAGAITGFFLFYSFVFLNSYFNNLLTNRLAPITVLTDLDESMRWVFLLVVALMSCMGVLVQRQRLKK
ncbi:hypothetical protein [Salsuginibacillus kocurii]|uniref:hypothetical protein n=1 Tax=Salsuginibacillus kocurii TaxID=427078 RepID=UPI0012E9EDFC|nr:hypothetical protein [Salsuginibacillus kocurii]